MTRETVALDTPAIFAMSRMSMVPTVDDWLSRSSEVA
jgi:hypothetical protein